MSSDDEFMKQDTNGFIWRSLRQGMDELPYTNDIDVQSVYELPPRTHLRSLPVDAQFNAFLFANTKNTILAMPTALPDTTNSDALVQAIHNIRILKSEAQAIHNTFSAIRAFLDFHNEELYRALATKNIESLQSAITVSRAALLSLRNAVGYGDAPKEAE